MEVLRFGGNTLMPIRSMGTWRLRFAAVCLIAKVLLFLPFAILCYPLLFISPDFALGMSDFVEGLREETTSIADELERRILEGKKDVD